MHIRGASIHPGSAHTAWRLPAARGTLSVMEDAPPDGANDTDPRAAAVLRRLARELSAGRKLDAARAMSRALRSLAEAGVRSRHPGADEHEVRRRLAAVMLPRETVIAAFGWDPREHGY